MNTIQIRFRRAALAGFLFAGLVTTTFVLLPIIGLTAAYIQQILDGTDPSLLLPETEPPALILNALGLFIIAPITFGSAALFWKFAVEAVVGSEQIWLYHPAQVFIAGLFSISLFLGAGYQYAFLRNHDTTQMQGLMQLILSIQFVFNVTQRSIVLLVIIGGYRAHTLPVWVCWLLGIIEISLIIFDFVALIPTIHATKFIAGNFFGAIRTLLLAIYFWLVSRPTPEETTIISKA